MTKIYLDEEVSRVWGSEAGDDAALTSEGLADGAGRRGELDDWGAAPRADRYRIECWAQFQATPNVGDVLRVYLYEGGTDTATPDHDEMGGGTDAAISSEDELRNAAHVLSVIVTEASADTEFYAQAVVEITSRHFGVALWNATGASTTTDASETKVRVTAIPPDIQ